MKILLCTDKMSIGGAETHVKMLAEQLTDDGDEVVLVSAGGEFEGELKALGCKCVHAPLDKRDTKSILLSAKILKREMADCKIAHAHTRYTSTLISLLRGRSRLPALVSTAHLPFDLSLLSKRTKWGDRTLAVSPDIAEYLIREYRLPKERVHLVKNGIDKSFFAAKREPRGYILHVSRLDTGRSLTAFTLIEAAEELFCERGELRLVIVGDGDRMGELSSAARAANERMGCDRIILGGATTDVLPALVGAELFVGASRAALEAMAVGIPTVISGDEGYGGIVGKCDERMLLRTNLCARGEAGVTKEALLSDIKALLSSEELKEGASLSGKRFAEAYFNARGSLIDTKRAYINAITPPRVCILGYFGYGNLGDEATLDIAICALMRRGIKDIITLRGGKDGGGLPARGRYSPSGIIDALLHSDLLLLCGGNLLQDETSRRSLKYYRFVIELAHTMGKRIYMLSSGFGSFISRGGFSDFLRCLKLSSFSGARTSFDYSLLSAHCEDKGKIRLMPDLCFLYSGEKYKKRQSRYFAVILSRGSGLTPRVKELAEEYSLEPIFIGLYEKEDRKNANFAASQFSSRAYFPKSVDELFKLLSLCRFTLSTRLHGGIFSLISRTPCLLACNCEKNRAFIEEISKRSERLGIPCPLLPLRAICEHKLPETQDEDFNKLLTSLRDEVTSALDELFGKPI